jgi:hypothetical protein
MSEELKKKLDIFIAQNRRNCWEAEYEGQYCLGEKEVRKFFESLSSPSESAEKGTKLYGAYHAKDGLFFLRTVDGGVHIRKTKQPKDLSPVVMDVYLDYETWCSIIACMSWQGETAETWEAAKKFHGHRPGTISEPLRTVSEKGEEG